MRRTPVATCTLGHQLSRSFAKRQSQSDHTAAEDLARILLTPIIDPEECAIRSRRSNEAHCTSLCVNRSRPYQNLHAGSGQYSPS